MFLKIIDCIYFLDFYGVYMNSELLIRNLIINFQNLNTYKKNFFYEFLTTKEIVPT